MMPGTLETRRLAVRRRAVANFLLVLLEVARRTDGRLAVEALGQEGVVLHYRDVRTLVRRPAGFTIAARDFTVLIGLPPLWPFDRAEAPLPAVLTPDDFAHPNSDGRLFCLDTQGVTPGRLATLVYDNLRIHARRLDHALSQPAADYVRAHLAHDATDPRPLVPGETPADVLPAVPCDESRPAPGVVDVRPGVLGVALPPITGPVVLRFAGRAGEPVDRARATYLRAAAGRLRTGKPVWKDGPALAVADGNVAPSLLQAEVREITRTLAALGAPGIARSYLEVCDSGPPGTD